MGRGGVIGYWLFGCGFMSNGRVERLPPAFKLGWLARLGIFAIVLFSPLVDRFYYLEASTGGKYESYNIRFWCFSIRQLAIYTIIGYTI